MNGLSQFLINGAPIPGIDGYGFHNFSGPGIFATSELDPSRSLQLVDEVLTSLVLGTPVSLTMPGLRIMTPITVNDWSFKWQRYGIERLKRQDTRRPLRTKIKTSEFGVSLEGDKLERFTWGTKRDVTEFDIASQSIRLRERSAAFAKMIVELDIERLRAEMLTNPANYPVAHTLALNAGNSWVSGAADTRADIWAIANAMCASLGCQLADLSVALENDSANAALQDPTFLAARVNTTADAPGMADLQKYWGVGSVWSFNIRVADEVVDDNATTSSLYGPVAIIYYSGALRATPYDTSYGEFTFAVNFTWNKGVALAPWYEPDSTSWFFPWQNFYAGQITQSLAGGLITGTTAS